ncbi:MAG: DNA repair protein RadC [Bacilli bacterium]|nr:DNA repair protein RadC [Bacilli bacterium]
MKFKNLPDEEKPRERLYLYGAQNLSNEELMMILLKTGTKKQSVKDLSFALLIESGGVRNLKNMTYQKLIQIDGIGKVKAIEILALIELSKRMQEQISLPDILNCASPSNIITYFNYLFLDKKQEEFYVLYLDNKKKYLDKKKLFVGSINYSIAHPREIFKNAYLISASYLICIHNHPSGDPTPSKEDIQITKNLDEIGKMHAIYLVDHLIIGKDCYFSFYESHCILNTK